MTNVAPSEEYVLHCDVPDCQAQLSMVAGVARTEHGWGRVTVYNDPPEDRARNPHNPTAIPIDYDLCAEHYKQLMVVLQGRLQRFGDDDLWWERQD